MAAHVARGRDRGDARLHGDQHHGDDDDQHHGRAVARAVGAHRREQEEAAAAAFVERRGADQREVDRIEERDDGDRKDAERDAAKCQVGERHALERACVLRIGKIRLAGPAEEDDTVELDHHVCGQRHGEHERRRRHRHQHVDERLGQRGREQECLQ
jgi:hypothetical protein